MLRLRQMLRILGCEYAQSFLQKSAPLSSLAVAGESSVFLRKAGFVRKIDFHTTGNYLCTSSEPIAKENISEEPVTKTALGKIARRMRLSFTCKRCATRNSKTISKLSYEKGIVIVRCDGCKNNHLIADNLGWFSNQPEYRNIETMLAKRGENVCKIHNYSEGSIQITDNKDYNEKLLEKNETMREKPQDGEKDTPKS